MKVGTGLLDLLSKSKGKRIHHGRSPFFYTPILAVLMLSIVLVGCGDISLSGLLEKQMPGKLGITPKSAKIDRASSIAVAGTGGFPPYTFSATAGTFAIIDGVTYYTAPDFVSNVTIRVVDSVSNEATGSIEVIDSTGLSFPAAMTIAVGESTGFIIAEQGTPPYTFWLDGEGVLEFHDVLSDRVKYRSVVETVASVWVEDSDGTTRELVITVLP
jgi:hypothetical protein